jgi:hypothetical protein
MHAIPPANIRSIADPAGAPVKPIRPVLKPRTLYRVWGLSPEPEPIRITPDTLFANIACAPEEANPDHSEGLWFCATSGCPVPSAIIQCDRQRDETSAPVMRCPGCSAPMEFKETWRTIILVPVKPDQAGD